MNEQQTEYRLPKGTLLSNGKYRIEAYLASGGFGNTYVATDLAFDERVAVKELFVKGICGRNASTGEVSVSLSENRISFDAHREKFRKEARRIRKLNSRHVVKVRDLFDDYDTSYYVMDFIDGESLSTRLHRQRRPLTEAEVCSLLPQVLDGLRSLHAEHIWHLDLKPANIMVDRQGKVLLIDLGASKQLQTADGVSVSTSSAMAYTQGYAPPEQMDQHFERFGPWTDLYALGATLFHLLTLQRPPSASDILDDADAALAMPGVSSRMQQLVRWLMTPGRNGRPQSVEEVRGGWDEQTETTEGVAQVLSSVRNNQPIASQNEETFIASSLPAVKRLIDDMVFVAGGTFLMGATIEQLGDAAKDETPTHQVTLDSFYICKYQVTQSLWEEVMGHNPSYFKGENLPVENVSWNECQDFILRLNAMSGKNFRLPTEAEWEFAARGGNNSRGYKYAGSNNLNEVAWYGDNSGKQTHPVGTKSPNELGLYDMSGNVWEWCQDWYGKYNIKVEKNPQGPMISFFRTFFSSRVLRGGSWDSLAWSCRLSFRNLGSPGHRGSYYGLRLVLSQL